MQFTKDGEAKTVKTASINQAAAPDTKGSGRDNVTPMKLSPAKQIELCVQELNARYHHLVIGGKNRVMRMVPRSVGTGLEAEFFRLEEFRLLWSHDAPVCIGYNNNDTPKLVSKGKVWLNSPDANFLDGGLEFNPRHPPLSVTPNKKLNMWQGFGVNPSQCPLDDSEVSAYLDHVREVICAGNNEHYDYLMGYLAHWAQKPWEKPSVAVVLKAGQGTGKGTFMDALLTIAGGHGLASTSKNDVVGRFNSALEARSLVFFDEAFAGSKEASDMLKGLISENYTRLERKGIDGCWVQNRMRVFMASNHENIVRIETDDRRYLFLNVSSKHQQDREYFSKRSFMRQAHPSHEKFAGKLLSYLLAVDISGFDPYHAPVTDELTNQKIDCLKPEERWVYSLLVDGYMVAGSSWPARVPANECYQACRDWMDANKLKPTFGDPMKVIGKALNMAGIKSKNIRLSGSVVKGRFFPSLEECRNSFCESIKGTIDWDG